MLQITVPAKEFWDSRNNVFVNIKEQTLSLEHSLVSISKWESKYKKPFLSENDKTLEETLYYAKCMTLTQNVKPEVYSRFTQEHLDEINAYVKDSMTATWFNDSTPKNKKGGKEVITSELIYYWMISMQIPFECQKWHLNRLLTLIRVCSIKNQPDKKMSQKDILKSNARLNAARRKRSGSKG